MRSSFVFGVLGATLLLMPADRPGPYAAQQQPSLTFTRVTTEPPAADRASTGGVSWVDFDADGDLDLFVGNGYDVSADTAVPQANRLYENRSGRFVPHGGEGPLWEDSGFSSGSAWADFDNDGHVDAFVPNQRNQPNFLYRNDGDRFRRVDAPPVTSDEGLAFSATWADVDRDGWVDLFVSNGGLSAPRHNALYRNLDGKTFEARGAQGVTADSIQTGGATFVDVDLDGDQDLFVPGRESRLYRNDGDFQFTTLSRVLFANEPPLLSMALAGTWGDYDNDGDSISTSACTSAKPTDST